MTQEEIDLIYDHLHENYRYEDGKLIRTKEIHGSQIGRIMGTFRIHPEGYGYHVGAFTINKKNYNKRMSHLIYLYHYKEFPKYIRYVDGNSANVCIENLKNSRIRQNNKCIFEVENHKNITYKAEIIIENQKLNFGKYKTKNEAKKAIDYAKALADQKNITPKELLFKVKKYMGKSIEPKPIKTLPVGVLKDKNMFRADVRLGGVKKYLGGFKTPEEAHQAYLKAKQEYQAQ